MYYFEKYVRSLTAIGVCHMLVDCTSHGTIIQLEPGEAMHLRAFLYDDKDHAEIAERLKQFRKTLLERMEDDAYLSEEPIDPVLSFVRHSLDQMHDDQVEALFRKLRVEMRNRGLRWKDRRLAGEA